ncbi:MAG: hypothetical protein LBL91_02610 [Lachnospiraceae bacterium]|jgi:hypothetical protein|nr:hypothetical protein [Lachnospiraceae bacterium]
MKKVTVKVGSVYQNEALFEASAAIDLYKEDGWSLTARRETRRKDKTYSISLTFER